MEFRGNFTAEAQRTQRDAEEEEGNFFLSRKSALAHPIAFFSAPLCVLCASAVNSSPPSSR